MSGVNAGGPARGSSSSRLSLDDPANYTRSPSTVTPDISRCVTEMFNNSPPARTLTTAPSDSALQTFYRLCILYSSRRTGSIFDSTRHRADRISRAFDSNRSTRKRYNRENHLYNRVANVSNRCEETDFRSILFSF